MEDISLRPMTRALCRALFRGWENGYLYYRAGKGDARP